jgi:hypothetical protein
VDDTDTISALVETSLEWQDPESWKGAVPPVESTGNKPPMPRPDLNSTPSKAASPIEPNEATEANPEVAKHSRI